MVTVSIQNPVPAVFFPDIYEELLWKLLRRGVEERNERTGHTVRVLPFGPTSFSLDLSELMLPVAGNRKLFPATAAAEVAWMLMGTQDASFMLRHAKVVWEKFVEDSWPDMGPDGLPENPHLGPVKIVKAAYGYRWRKKFGRDQLRLAIEALKCNPSDRRIWISTWDPARDGLGALGQLNVPCPVGFTLSIVDGRLCSAYMLRSSDVFVGLPYDVMGHAMLMQAIAVELKVDLGVMHFTLAHPHLYDSHFEFAEESLHHKQKHQVPMILGRTVDRIVEDPDGYVELYRTVGKTVKWPDFCPRPDVIP